LSGGQQQRVAIARALAMQPRLMLFDEPTSALDPELVGEVLEAMKSLAQEGMTMLIVTHEMGFAAHVADRIAFIDEGRIIDSGPPRRVFHESPEPRVRQFLQTYHDRNAF
jgi:polar amino acid transport system ATP-binding protein